MSTSSHPFHNEGRRIGEDSLHSAKSHFASAEHWGWLHLAVGIPTTLVAAVAGVSALNDYPKLGGILAIAVAALSALATFLNPSGRQNAHLLAGNQYQALRNAARIFCEIDLADPDEESKWRQTLGKLADRRDELNMSSPQVWSCAFVKARARIAAGETEYEVDRSRRP